MFGEKFIQGWHRTFSLSCFLGNVGVGHTSYGVLAPERSVVWSQGSLFTNTPGHSSAVALTRILKMQTAVYGC